MSRNREVGTGVARCFRRHPVWHLVRRCFRWSLRCGCGADGADTPTKVDTEVAKLQKSYEGKPFAFSGDSIKPMHRIAFRCHPYAVEPGIDYSAGPTTLIIFELKEIEGVTRLTITESGFDRIPLERRAKAFEANDGGWSKQLQLIKNIWRRTWQRNAGSACFRRAPRHRLSLLWAIPLALPWWHDCAASGRSPRQA